ncbi:MAG TPA: TonB-dependent siderophore receptor [Verrucomicrobiae bacterium]|jgi:catecholate siderophore receptor|nr:TonB-dependent siderophore receptor [Verrucomicrobiae bacterium]
MKDQLSRQTRHLTTLLITQGIVAAANAQSTNSPACVAPGANAPSPLPEVVVTGQAGSYKTDGVALPKITQPLRDTPQTIDVIPREVMDDQNATTLRDALRNVSGISIAAGEGTLQGDNLTLRGFSAQDDIFLDGIRDIGSYYRDPFNYQEIDVLEGPESVMFGRGSTGGVVNQESKMPVAHPFVAGTLTLGTDVTRRGTVDVNEPVPELGTNTAFRLNVMGNDSDVARRDVTENERYGFAPSLTFGLGTPTRLTFSYFHQTEDDIPDYGIPWLKFLGQTAYPADVAHNNYYGFQDDHFNANADIGTVKLEHDFNDSVTLRDQFRYADYSRDYRITEPQVTNTAAAPLSDLSVNRNELGGDGSQTYLWDQLDLTTKFDTSSIEHTLVTGMEGGRETADLTRFTYGSVPGTSLISPNESQDFSGTIKVRSQVATAAETFGVYALDTMKLGEHWELSGGARFDYFDASDHMAAVGTTPATNFNQTITKPSWRGALVYKPIEIGSIYFAYGTSWDPSAENLALSALTANTPPEENESFEFGAKWDLFHDRLSVRGSVFRTEQSNTREPDPTDITVDTVAGDERVDGIELAMSGHLTKDWLVLATYDYLDSEMVSSKYYPLSVGQPLSNVPKNSANLWTTYNLPWKFEIGAGIAYVGSRYANSSTLLAPTIPGAVPEEDAPSYYIVDALIKYKASKRITCQVNINNLTDRFYYAQVFAGHVVPGAGISALFSTSFKF